MSDALGGYSPRRAGEVVGVEVVPEDDRPVKITLHDHPYRYEIAWQETAAGPIVTDLRIMPIENAVRITTNSIRRINVDRLARTAAMHDTPEAAEAARRLAQAVQAVTGEPSWLETFRFTEGVVDAMARHAPPGAKLPQKRKGGRPRLSTDFLTNVAVWAKQAETQGHAIYPYVAQRAAERIGYTAADETVKGWVRRCKDIGLLKPGDLRRPRTPRTPTPTPTPKTERTGR